MIDTTIKRATTWRRGYDAENKVAQLFREDGCEILGRRVRTPYGEIDLIVSDAETIVFIEVKLRATIGSAAFCLTRRQRDRISAAAQFCLETQPDWRQPEARIDLILIDPVGRMRRIKDISRAM